MDMDVKSHIHGNPGNNCFTHQFAYSRFWDGEREALG